MQKKIGINGQMLLTNEPAGPELYTINLIRALAEADNTNLYTLYFPAEPDAVFWQNLTDENPNFSYKVIDKSLSWTQTGLMKALYRDTPDVFFTAVHTMPMIRKPGMKTVGMIHGLEYNYAGTSGNLIRKLSLGKPEWFVAKYAEILIVPSNHTRKMILEKNWGIPESKITVVPEGVSGIFRKYPDEEISTVRERYGLTGRYLLFISTIQPRKNLPKLIEGFSLALKELGGMDFKLVVVGKKGWDYEESLRAPERFHVQNNVLFLGRVEDSDLPPLLSGARAYVSTSFEEGFGLPLLEAMASEVPAIVSSIEAYTELAGDSVWYVNPEDAEDIKNKVKSLMHGEYNQGMVEKAKEIAGHRTWENTARETLSVFEKVTGS